MRPWLLLGALVLAAAGALLLYFGAGETGIVGEEVHLLSLAERAAFEGEPGFRVHSIALAGSERVVLPLDPPASVEFRRVETSRGATLSFAVGSLEQGWEGREEFTLSVERDGAPLFERVFRRADFPSGAGWNEVSLPLPAGGRSHAFRFAASAPGPPKTNLQAVLLADPVLRAPGRAERVSPAARGIVVLLADTLRADRLSFMGYRRPTTPNLDRLAASSVRCRNAFSPSSWTKPAVASLFTGLAPARHGATNPFSSLPPGTPSLADALRGAGFRTGAFVNNRLISLPSFGFNRGFDSFNAVDARAEGVLDLAATWIESHRAERFFAYVHLFDPHEPYSPPSPFDRRFVEEVAPGGIPTAIPTELEHRLREALYDGEVAYLDARIGSFLNRLSRLGLDSRTTIVFVSDHGEEFWEHGGERHGHTVYDELLRIPLLFRGARRDRLEPTDVRGPVTIEDLFPTLCRLGGAEAPRGIDGEDLARAIRRERRGDAGQVRSLFHETDLFQRRAFAVRRGNRKYAESVRYDGGAPEAELYDLGADPGEKRNLISQDPSGAASLAALLAAHRALAGRGSWHLSFRAARAGAEFSGEIEASGGIEDLRAETGAEGSPLEMRREGERVSFRVRAEGTTAGVAFRVKDPTARVRLLAVGEGFDPSCFRLGSGDRRAQAVPIDLAPGDADSAEFLLDPAPRLDTGKSAACRVWRFAPPEVRPEDLPPEDLERFRALGYVR